LKVKDVKGKKVGTSIQIKEGKINILLINNAVYKAIQKYIKERAPDDERYLFKSRKGTNKPITI